MPPPQRVSVQRLVVRKQKRSAPRRAVIRVIARWPAVQKSDQPNAVIQTAATPGRQEANVAALQRAQVLEIGDDRGIKEMSAQATIVSRGRLHTPCLRVENKRR